MAAKAVVRDVGRVLDLPYGFVRRHRQADPVPAWEAHHAAPRRARWSRCSPSARRTRRRSRELLALAESLEGLTRNVGMHAGGVLIAPGKLTDFCPLYVPPGSDAIVSQFDKDDVEAVGLVKFDFLGLTHADDPRLDAALRARARPRTARSTLERLPLDDQAAYDILQRRQHDRGVPVRIARHARAPGAGAADRFEDIIALVALYRPGPMDLIPDYIDAQARARAGRVPRPAARADPGAHLRRDGVPGAGDADRAGHRRLHAGRRRPAAPRDGQEEAGGDGRAARHLRRGRGSRTACRGPRRRSSST